jgi:putative tricarboxylic transport membrane protein
LVLGLILGPIAENNFLQGSMIADATEGRVSYFLTGTLNLVLIGLVLASIAFSFWSTMGPRARRAGTAEVQT